MQMRGEKGITLLETILALAIMGIISASYLSGTAATSTARVTSDERASGKVLAESLMETIKKVPYAASYNVTVPADFAGYSANVSVVENNNIQDISIRIERRNREILTLESYKVNRQ
jgi:prepilin-type N-terminal cleavage/methylation domain-containing protein